MVEKSMRFRSKPAKYEANWRHWASIRSGLDGATDRQLDAAAAAAGHKPKGKPTWCVGRTDSNRLSRDLEISQCNVGDVERGGADGRRRKRGSELEHAFTPSRIRGVDADVGGTQGRACLIKHPASANCDNGFPITPTSSTTYVTARPEARHACDTPAMITTAPARANQACRRCYNRKKKCSRTLPRCQACEHSGVQCSFEEQQEETGLFYISCVSVLPPTPSLLTAQLCAWA